MHKIALALACLTCAGNGRRVKVTTEHMQEGSYEEHIASLEETEAKAKGNPVKVLALLLAGSTNPTDAFSLPARAHARSVRMHDGVLGQKFAANHSIHHRTAVPWDWKREAHDEKRAPWRWKQFNQHLSKFVESQWPFEKTEVTHLIPGDSLGHLQLFPVDDAVVGGTSASTFDNDSRRWKGELASFGVAVGFVGIGAKTLSPLDLTGTSGIELKLRSDGKERYFTFILRESDKAWGGGFMVGSPDAQLVPWNGHDKLTFESVRIPYSAFTPMLPAETVPGVNIDLTNIVAVQLALFYDLNLFFTGGAFELDLLDVGTY